VLAGQETPTVTPRPTASVEEAERLAAFCRQGLAFLVSKGAMSSSLAAAFPAPERLKLAGSLTAARLSGLREAAHDVVTVLTHYLESAPTVSEADIDSFLLARGAPRLSQMRARYWERLAKILRKASITSDEEYRLVSEALSDTGSIAPSSAERQMLEQLAAKYLRASSGA